MVPVQRWAKASPWLTFKLALVYCIWVVNAAGAAPLCLLSSVVVGNGQVLQQEELADVCLEGLQAMAVRTYTSINAEPFHMFDRPKHSFQNWQLPVVVDPSQG